MTHKHQDDVIDAVDFMKPSYGTEKHKAIQVEVDEVYRKAEAFDEILRIPSTIDSLHHSDEVDEIIDDYKSKEAP